MWFPGPGGYGEISTSGDVTVYYSSSSPVPSGAIAATPDEIWLTRLPPSNNSNPATLLAINPATGNVATAYRYCNFAQLNQPEAIVANGSTVYAGCETTYLTPNSYLSSFTPAGATGSLETFIDANTSPSGYVITKGGLVWSPVAPRYLTYVDTSNGSTNAATSPTQVTGGSIAIGPDGNLWFANDGVGGQRANIEQYVLASHGTARLRRVSRPLVRQTGQPPRY